MNISLLFLVLAISISQVLSIDGNVNKQACIRESSVNPALVEKAYNGNIANARELQCYFKCYYENAGFINSKGEIQADKMKANVPTGVSKSLAGKAIDICRNKKGTDACETSYLVQKCLLDNSVQY